MKKWLKKSIRGYQKYISPLTPPTCRYEPTCSHYALEAIDKHGAFKGSLMAIGRICRCHPFVKGGVDPVPNYFTLRRNRFKDERHYKQAHDYQLTDDIVNDSDLTHKTENKTTNEKEDELNG